MVIDLLFKTIWQEGKSLEDPGVWPSLLEQLGMKQDISFPEEVKSRLAANGEEALAKGIFGVPTFWVEGEIFWGLDSWEFFKDYLKNPGLLRTAEMKRCREIPVGASRSVI